MKHCTRLRISALSAATAGVSLIGCAHRALPVIRVPRASVTGAAAAAVDDSAMFASPVVPRGVRPIVPAADAESAAVAMGYWDTPSYQDLTALPTYHLIRTERRHFCGRAYYVRPVLVMPDTTVVPSRTLNDWQMWAPTWVVPICDDKGIVSASVMLTDLPPGMRVIQGPGPRDVPELVPDSGTFPHITFAHSKQTATLERGMGMTPETAVAAITSLLAKTGARVADVPDAFAMVRLMGPQPPLTAAPRVFGGESICPRWRLTLDRPITLRGTTSGQIVHTQTVFVTRSLSACRGVPVVQIPKPSQPTTVPFVYYISRPAPAGRRFPPPPPEIRWTKLRVSEPIWFEAARLQP